ncbi:hypothetical protein BJX64DRAFT_287231 [Aspergillus heterothallicus]
MFDTLRKADISQEMTLPLLLVCVYASLGGMGFGMDYNYWSGFLGMTQFKKDFGVYNAATDKWYIPSTWQSVATGTPTAGLAMGALVSGCIGNRIGRVKTFFVSGVIGLVGILIQACSFGSYWQLMVGRIVNAVSLGIVCNAVPAYQSECAPVKIRGSLINTYQFSLLVGGTLIQTANWGLNSRTDQWAYRVAIILQFIVPVLLLIGSYALPESPRWLVGKGRRDDACKVLHLLRQGTAPDLIEKEADLLMLAEEVQQTLHGSASWLHCFRGANLRRTAIATGMQCMQQTQGSGFMSNYLVVFLQGIGITNEYRMTVLMTFTNAMSCGFAFYFVDRLGRRPLILVSTVVMGAAMFAIAGVTGFGDQGAHASGALAGLFLWQIFQAIGWSSCVWIVTAEVATLQLREKTITIATFSGFVVNVLVTYISPFIQDEGHAGLEGRIGFIWGGFSVLAFVWAFLVVPELKGRSLEELDELFENSVPTLKFSKHECSGYGAQLTVAEEVAHSESETRDFVKGLWGLQHTAIVATCRMEGSPEAHPRREDLPPYPTRPAHAPDVVPAEVFASNREMFHVKRVLLDEYYYFRDIPMRRFEFLAETLVLETIAGPNAQVSPHPNIIRYHGCRVNRGYITGIILQRLEYTLHKYVAQPGFRTLDKKGFVARLRSAVDYLHSLGLAHNDINPSNIMVSETPDGQPEPVLIDFGSCGPIGLEVWSLGTPGWFEEPFKTSEKKHDLYSLAKLEEWLETAGSQ